MRARHDTDDVIGAKQFVGAMLKDYAALPSYRAMLDIEGVQGIEAISLIGSQQKVPDGLGRIHDRMPLLVPQDQWATWLNPEQAPSGEVVVPAVATGLEAYPVGTRVNNVKHNRAELIEPLPAS